jgi:hypothetical protein
MRWTEKELNLLKSLAKNAPVDALSARLERPIASIRRKARREGIKLQTTIALPELDGSGRLKRLGGIEIPSRPRWTKRR